MINNNYNHLQKAMPYLNEYAKKALCTKVDEKGAINESIEVHVNQFAIEWHTIHVGDLLAGMGYNISNDGEVIYIQ